MSWTQASGKTLLALTLSLGLLGTANAKDLVIAADPWCPFNCEPGSDRPGVMVEIAREVFEPLGYTVTYETINWSRALVETREGKFDAVFGATPGDAEDFVFPESAQSVSGNAYFVRADDDWTYAKPEDLSGKTIGLIRDYAYGDEIQANIDAHAQAEYAGGEDPLTTNIKKLLAGRIDIVLEDASVFMYAANELGAGDKVRLVHSDDSGPIYIALSPAKDHSKELAGHLDTGMAELRDSGKLNEILAKYGLKDWESGS